jgi:hypothetical protein
MESITCKLSSSFDIRIARSRLIDEWQYYVTTLTTSTLRKMRCYVVVYTAKVCRSSVELVIVPKLRLQKYIPEWVRARLSCLLYVQRGTLSEKIALSEFVTINRIHFIRLFTVPVSCRHGVINYV